MRRVIDTARKAAAEAILLLQGESGTGKSAPARVVADETNAKAEVDRAKAVPTANETDLEKAVIRSPINGFFHIQNNRAILSLRYRSNSFEYRLRSL